VRKSGVEEKRCDSPRKKVAGDAVEGWTAAAVLCTYSVWISDKKFYVYMVFMYLKEGREKNAEMLIAPISKHWNWMEGKRLLKKNAFFEALTNCNCNCIVTNRRIGLRRELETHFCHFSFLEVWKLLG
jgi:hypothetical protein